MKEIDHKAIGNTEPVCPYCSNKLERMPGRKKKCPTCGNFIYVRTRPLDRKRVLVTEKQADEVERQWQAEQENNELKQEYLYVKEEFNEQLMEKFGREPSDSDVFLCLYNKQSLEYARKSEWGLYRNTRHRMAKLLLRENKQKQALGMFIEVSYLDANGPVNCGVLDAEFLSKFPPFNPKLGIQAPHVLSDIAIISVKLGTLPLF